MRYVPISKDEVVGKYFNGFSIYLVVLDSGNYRAGVSDIDSLALRDIKLLIEREEHVFFYEKLND